MIKNLNTFHEALKQNELVTLADHYIDDYYIVYWK
jgi:hypothetical protein